MKDTCPERGGDIFWRDGVDLSKLIHSALKGDLVLGEDDNELHVNPFNTLLMQILNNNQDVLISFFFIFIDVKIMMCDVPKSKDCVTCSLSEHFSAKNVFFSAKSHTKT